MNRIDATVIMGMIGIILGLTIGMSTTLMRIAHALEILAGIH